MYENPDGNLLADHEKRQVPPVTLPVQERHRVWAPADHDKQAWCRVVCSHLNSVIARNRMELRKLREDAFPLEERLKVMLGDANPFGDNRLWEILRLGSVSNQKPHHGTWAEVRACHREWKAIDDNAAPIADRLIVLKEKRIRYQSILDELKANIEHWEGV